MSDVRYSKLDVELTGNLYRALDGLEEKLVESINQDVIKALEQTNDLVTIGTPPMVIIDKINKHYDIIYGFGEQRRAYSQALEARGYKFRGHEE